MTGADSDHIVQWLRHHSRTQALLLAFGSIALFIAGILILVVTWGITYLISLQTLGWWIGHSHWIHSKVGLMLIPLLFWGNARTSREYLANYEVAPSPRSDKVVILQVGMHHLSNVDPFARKTVGAVTKMITDCLYCGPRTVTSAIRTLRKAIRIHRLDTASCGIIITMLLNAPGKVTLQQLMEQTEGINPGIVFAQLRDIDGIIFLQTEPPGLTLSSQRREYLSSLKE